MRFDVGKGVREDYAKQDEVLMVVLMVLRFFSCLYLAFLPDNIKHFVRVDEVIGWCGDCVSREKKMRVLQAFATQIMCGQSEKGRERKKIYQIQIDLVKIAMKGNILYLIRISF